MQKTIEKIGVVAELDGKYWGVEYEDGHSTSYNFGSIENAKISDPEFCKKPEDKTWDPNWPNPGSRYNPEYEILKKAKLRTVKITTVYEIEDAPQKIVEAKPEQPTTAAAAPLICCCGPLMRDLQVRCQRCGGHAPD
jgi:hypothetical protein